MSESLKRPFKNALKFRSWHLKSQNVSGSQTESIASPALSLSLAFTLNNPEFEV